MNQGIHVSQNNVVMDKNNIIWNKTHTINGNTIQHIIYTIPNFPLQRLYNVKVNGILSMAMTFICDNNKYAIEQAYKLMAGLFSPQKLSAQRMKHHTWTYLKGELTVQDK